MQTPESTLEALASRVEQLERQYHALKSKVETENLFLWMPPGKQVQLSLAETRACDS